MDITGNEKKKDEEVGDPPKRVYISNFYNNIDLAAGDADNDGSCDLVISYGASDVNADGEDKREVLRSLASSSVLLFGSNGEEETTQFNWELTDKGFKTTGDMKMIFTDNGDTISGKILGANLIFEKQ